MFRSFAAGCTVLLLAGAFAPAHAAPVTFSGGLTNSATNRALSGTAAFSVVGNQLQVVLTNTATTTSMSPSDLLAAVFFDVTGGPSLTYVSGTAQSLVNANGTPNASSLSVGNEWALAQSASGLNGGLTQHYGLGGAGFGVFPSGPGGQDYLLATSVFNGGGNLNAQQNPFIKNSITLLVSGIPGGFNPLASISNVRLQWGTALSEPSTGGICVIDCGFTQTQLTPNPEPGSMILLGSGILAAARRYRRRRP